MFPSFRKAILTLIIAQLRLSLRQDVSVFSLSVNSEYEINTKFIGNFNVLLFFQKNLSQWILKYISLKGIWCLISVHRFCTYFRNKWHIPTSLEVKYIKKKLRYYLLLRFRNTVSPKLYVYTFHLDLSRKGIILSLQLFEISCFYKSLKFNCLFLLQPRWRWRRHSTTQD